MQHIQIPTVKPILYGSVAALVTFAVAFGDAGIGVGIKKCRIHASPTEPVLLEFYAEVITPFNAATTNLLTVGSTNTLGNGFLGAADITEGTAGFYPANNATKKYRLTADTDVFVFYNGGVQATGTLTGDTVIVANGDIVVVGDPAVFTKTYTFQTVLTNVDGNVKIGASAAASMTNLFNAINGTGGVIGTDYAASTLPHKTVSATNPTATTVVATSIRGGTQGNTIATTTTSAHLAWGGAVLTGGTSGAPTAGSALIYMNVTYLAPSPNNVLGALA